MYRLFNQTMYEVTLCKSIASNKVDPYRFVSVNVKRSLYLRQDSLYGD